MNRIFVVEDDKSTAENCEGCDGAVEIFELEPVEMLWLAGRWEVADVTEEGDRSGSRGKVGAG